ncbi:MAG: Asp-tRNA(Asn)/Glu-tRNA(Gln) amidotransferase subunit GatC [Cellvibrionaceae bacterium]
MDANEIAKLAQLAKINIDNNMVDDVAESITSILTLVDQLQAVDTSNIEPMSHPMDAVQRLRADIVTENNQREQLQTTAPAVDNGLFLVPKVID